MPSKRKNCRARRCWKISLPQFESFAWNHGRVCKANIFSHYSHLSYWAVCICISPSNWKSSFFYFFHLMEWRQVPVNKSIKGRGFVWCKIWCCKRFFNPCIHWERLLHACFVSCIIEKTFRRSWVNYLWGNDLQIDFRGGNIKSLDVVLPFLSASWTASHVDRWRRCEKSTWTLLRSGAENYNRQPETFWNDEHLQKLQAKLRVFDLSMVRTFPEHYSLRLYTLKFHLLDYVDKDLPNFGTLLVLNASPFEHYNLDGYKPSVQVGIERSWRQFGRYW